MGKPVQNMLGLLGRPRPIMKDSDKDGVPNRYDCQPYNPNKQGLVHDVAKAAARKGLRGRFKHRAVKYIEKKEREAAERKKVRIEVRQKQRLETTKVREETRGERARESIKKGGFVRQTVKSFAAPRPAPTTSRVVYTRGKKGKKGRRRIVTTTAPRKLSPAARGESLSDFMNRRSMF